MRSERLVAWLLLVVGSAFLGCATRYDWQQYAQKGAALYSFEEYDEARGFFEEALDIAEGLPDDDVEKGGEKLDVLSLEWLGATAAKQERFADAEGFYRDALGRREALFGESTRLADSILPLSRLRARQGDQAGAFALHDRWRAIRLERPEPEKPLAWADAQLAEAFHEAEAYDTAAMLFERSLETRPAKKGRIDVAPVLAEYAKTLQAAGETEHAKSVRSTRSALIADTDYVAAVLYSRNFSEMVARWKLDQMPLRIRIRPPPRGAVRDPDAAMAIAREAVLAWSGTIAEGLPSFEFTKWSGDITVRWSEDRSGYGYVGICRPYVQRSESPLQRASVRVFSRVVGFYLSDQHLRHVVMHEMGHALGLLGHSKLPEDVMFAVVPEEPVGMLTDRDLATLRKLYGQKAGEAFKW